LLYILQLLYSESLNVNVQDKVVNAHAKKACKGTELNLLSFLSWPLRLRWVIIFTPRPPYPWESLLSPSNWVGSRVSRV